MLNSILTKYDEIQKVLEKRRDSHKRHRNCLQYIECLQKSTLSNIVNLLEPFKKWTDYIEADKCITIDRVWPIHLKVKKHLEVSSEEDSTLTESKNFKVIEGIKALGREYIKSIKKDFEPTMEQNIAIALHARTKKLTKMPQETREATYNKIAELISNDSQQSPPVIAPKEKKRKSQNLFDSFADSDEEDTHPNETMYGPELDEYLRVPYSENSACKDDETSNNQCKWWFKHRSIYPKLFKLFMRISCIPASSAPSERCFSVTGQIISEKRSSILPENVANIMMNRNLYVN